MPIQGEIKRAEGGSDTFTLPDPRQGEQMISGRVQIQPNTWRHIIWAPNHMLEKGSGRIYLKHQRIGVAIDMADLPTVGTSKVLTDSDTGVTISVTRT